MRAEEGAREAAERRLTEAWPVAYRVLRDMLAEEYPMDESVVSIVETWGGVLSGEERLAVRRVEAALNVASGGARLREAEDHEATGGIS